MIDDGRRHSLTPRATRSAALVAAIVLAGCGGGKDVAAPTTTAPRPVARHLPPNGIRIEWKEAALRPAVRPGRLCIVTVKTGRFCARYETGQIPATALKIKLLEHGYIPVTVKRPAVNG